jgi:AAA family ATPase
LQDEIDALASSRSSTSSSDGGSHEGVLTSLLNEMDGVQELVGVTVVAATNRPEIIVSFFKLLASGLDPLNPRTLL